MAALVKAVRISKTINNATRLLNNLSLPSNSLAGPSTLCNVQRIAAYPIAPVAAASFHTTRKRSDLMEFFDDKKNWGENEVKTGRSWKKDELRLKSNQDLHKLWFVLLKERNMLLTMEEACKQDWQVFPTPERIDKVADSMENLESVVRERNVAYHMLETGELGERPVTQVYNQLGLKMRYRMRQYVMPKFMNRKWHELHKFSFGGYAVAKFRRLYKEKLWNQRRKARNREANRVRALIRKFPNLDYEAVRQEYPSVDIEKVKRRSVSRGHYVPK